MNVLKQLIKRWLLRHDIVLSRPPGQFIATAWKLRALRKRGVDVRVAVDGGAAEGGWATEFLTVYPQAAVICVEPREDAQEPLRKLAASEPRVRIVQSCLGSDEKETTFYLHGHQSSSLPTASGEGFGRATKVRVVTLDGLIGQLGCGAPDFIKLDLQGSEVEALNGASESLKNAKAVQLELSFLPFQKGMPLAAEVVAFMQARGFVCYDILALWTRPLDGALAQGDFLFVPADSPLRQNPRWGENSPWS